MPHLSIETYVTQYFWLVVILFSFYFIAVSLIIPKISLIIKTRRKVENQAVEGQSKEESPASKQSTIIISNSIAGSKSGNLSVDSNKYYTHFVNSNKNWINKTLSA